jgi:hypothetical protein
MLLVFSLLRDLWLVAQLVGLLLIWAVVRLLLLLRFCLGVALLLWRCRAGVALPGAALLRSGVVSVGALPARSSCCSRFQAFSLLESVRLLQFAWPSLPRRVLVAHPRLCLPAVGCSSSVLRWGVEPELDEWLAERDAASTLGEPLSELSLSELRLLAHQRGLSRWWQLGRPRLLRELSC